MKKLSRAAALIIAAILSLSLTACGGSGDQADPLIAAQANMIAASSMDASMTMNMEMEVAGESFKTVTGMDVTIFTEPARMKVEATAEAAGLGKSTFLIYAEEEDDGSYTMYMKEDDHWYSSITSAEDLGQYEVNQNMSAFIKSASSFRQEGTETVNGVSAYKYTGVITGENMKDVMVESGALNSLSSLGVEEGQLEDMLSDLGDISVTLWISEEDLYPVRYDMDMTAVMDGLMQSVVEGMGEQIDGLTMSIPEMTLTMTCSNFNSATEFSIPAEAKK